MRGLGTESSTPGTKDYVFLYRVRPGSVPDNVPSDRVVWATWKELTKARSTGYLATGSHIQYPLRHEYFGKPIDKYKLERTVGWRKSYEHPMYVRIGLKIADPRRFGTRKYMQNIN